MKEEILQKLRDWLDHELIPLSALEHFSYCPRQAALIHLEAVWEENVFTLRGRYVHEAADLPGEELQDGVRVERALPLYSRRLGLVGKADIVEFYGNIPYPVDYKHGPKRRREHDDLQLCGQAVCLEEMMGVPVPKGAIYHASSRRRREVEFDPPLRRRLEEAVAELRGLLGQSRLPPAVADERCRHCSLAVACLPEATCPSPRLVRYLTRLWQPPEEP